MLQNVSKCHGLAWTTEYDLKVAHGQEIWSFNNVNMNHTATRREYVNWIKVAQNKDK
jgi:hypothetical protein